MMRRPFHPPADLLRPPAGPFLMPRPPGALPMPPMAGLGATVRPGTLRQNGLGDASTVGAAVFTAGSWIGSIAGAYHGYKRNDSVGWAIAWFFLGGIFWPIALPVMYAQGFAKRKGR